MITNISSFIAQKYLKFKNKDRNISLMIKICFLGILIGTFSLMLTLIIMHGFEKTIHEKMQGINSQVIIYSPGNKLDYDSIKNVLTQEFSSSIEAISGSSTRQILIDKNKKQSVLFVKGIDPINESKVTNIAQKIILPDRSNPSTNHSEQTAVLGTCRPKRLAFTTATAGQREGLEPVESSERVNFLETLLQENQIIIGTKTAQNYGLKIGDKIDLLIPEPGSKKKIFLNKKQAVISGIFKIGLEEYDNNFAFCSLTFLQKLFDEKKGVDQISLKLKNQKKSFLMGNNTEEKTIKNLRQRLPMLMVCSWKDLYPALVSSLKLEKYVMFFILALITLVACMTMISLLFMYIQQKRRDIAILTSIGLANRKIRSIFLKIGLLITFLGSICGLAFAAIAGYFLEKYPFITLPDVYYISYLPARMEPELFLLVFVVTMFLGFLATWIPAQRTKKIKVAQVLRQE